MASAELSRRVEKIVAYSMLTTTMNIYIHELDDGLGGADNLDGLWGHRGATEDPQTAANGTDTEQQNPGLDAAAADSREALD